MAKTKTGKGSSGKGTPKTNESKYYQIAKGTKPINKPK
jgi:hypothetical protein